MTSPRNGLRGILQTILGAASIVLAGSWAAPAGAVPVFNLNFTTGTPESDAGFVAAANEWSGLFADDVTINLDVAFTKLPGFVGFATTKADNYFYSSVSGALAGDATSVADVVATAGLPVGPSFPLLINRTANSPHGSGSATPYLDDDGDANNQQIRMANATAKALGLRAPNDTTLDGSIAFSTSVVWDFDPSDGIDPGARDFIGTAIHEIGHVLGFISGVDVLDRNSPPLQPAFSDDAFSIVRILDLFRYSEESAAQGAIDWTADNRDKFFSIDAGVTFGAQFATGVTFGDGFTAGHWKDDLDLGILDPRALEGELLGISQNDILALDVIGWDVAQIPEPATLLLLCVGLVGIEVSRRRRIPGRPVRHPA